MSELFNLAAIAKRMETQDNLSTCHPVYVVESATPVYGIEEGFTTDGFTWVEESSSEEVESDHAETLEMLYAKTGVVREGYSRRCYRNVYTFVQAFFTRKAAELYIEQNHYNLREPRIFVHSAHRNYEWQEVAKAVQTGTIDLNAKVLRKAVEEVYIALINHRDDSWRADNQTVYCELRDALAFISNTDPKAVQEEFEAKALAKIREEESSNAQD